MAGQSFIDDDIREQLSRNEKLVETFLEHGADLDEERPVDFFFYTESPEAARALADDLEANGFDEAAVLPEPTDGKWGVQAIKKASVNGVTDAAFVEKLVRIAANHLAEFDGWGAAV
jgi:hypothetical protein